MSFTLSLFLSCLVIIFFPCFCISIVLLFNQPLLYSFIELIKKFKSPNLEVQNFIFTISTKRWMLKYTNFPSLSVLLSWILKVKMQNFAAMKYFSTVMLILKHFHHCAHVHICSIYFWKVMWNAWGVKMMTLPFYVQGFFHPIMTAGRTVAIETRTVVERVGCWWLWSFGRICPPSPRLDQTADDGAEELRPRLDCFHLETKPVRSSPQDGLLYLRSRSVYLKLFCHIFH